VTDFAAQIVRWINVPANFAGRFLLCVIGELPGWLSNTIISAVAGVLLLIIFKFTSNQRAIGRVRDDIKADMLAIKLFKESMSVTLKCQAGIFAGAVRLLFHSIRPLLVMVVPVSLLLAQMGLWYQSRPLRVGEEAVVTVELNDAVNSPWPEVSIEPKQAAEVTVGPVKVLSKRQVYFKISALDVGYHRLGFWVDGQRVEKELAAGEGFMRVSAKRPGWSWTDILMHPAEKPFGPDSVVRSISIDYPNRLSRTSGTDWWVVYFFVVSMFFALMFRPFLRVRI
jgi:uncharacterized membrane protein (DUF106 family)